MTELDLTLPTPAENLACDEALLDHCEASASEGVLRFWEPQSYFVVVGYGNPLATEVRRETCERNGVPILRRCSGGGTVLQGPGCLNYSLLLEIEPGGPLHSIPAANRFIMERNRAAIQSIAPSQPIEVRGHTDLAMGARKFSGNAQRRRKRFLLFHGTFLLRFDIALIETFLPMPAKQPVYRQQRPHRDFLANLDLPVESVKSALRAAWRAGKSSEPAPLEAASRLARDKYVTREWIERF